MTVVRYQLLAGVHTKIKKYTTDGEEREVILHLLGPSGILTPTTMLILSWQDLGVNPVIPRVNVT
jgi:hypothetical protein